MLSGLSVLLHHLESSTEIKITPNYFGYIRLNKKQNDSKIKTAILNIVVKQGKIASFLFIKQCCKWQNQ